MRYSAQHNGKGKLHLIGKDDIECGSKGTMLFTGAEEVIFENGNFFTVFTNGSISSTMAIFENDFCKKCLNKIRSKMKGIIHEHGKTFSDIGNGDYWREHDHNFHGDRFKHRRCPFCNRMTSKHILHWLNHLEKCAPQKYSIQDLADLRYCKINELKYERIGRK